ncbi:MAG: S41 family peptidase [Myxococcaceae bacterium]
MLLALAALAIPAAAWATPPPDGGPAPVAAASALSVSVADREAESRWLAALGLHLPDAGVVLSEPYRPPWTSRSFVVPHTWFSEAGATVAAASLLQDLDLLREAMSRTYGGWETAQARGWNWDAWFRDWKAALGAQGTRQVPLEKAFIPVQRLMEFQLDNHTNIPLSPRAFFGSGSTSVVLVAAPEGPCAQASTASGDNFPLDVHDAGQQVHQAQAWDGAALHKVSYLSYPQRRGRVTQLYCAGAWVKTRPVWEPAPLDIFHPSPLREAAILALSGATRDHPFLVRLAPGVAYLRLPTFTKENAVDIEEHLSSWAPPMAQDRILIVDLRDNGGGDAAVQALAGWVELQRLKPAFHGTTHRSASCLYPALRWGYTAITSRHLLPPLPPGIVEGLQEALDPLFLPFEPGCPRRTEDEKGEWNYAMHRLAPPGAVQGHRRILVLVNNGCGSDCEFMTYLLASLPETVVAGSNTYGVAQYIQPGYAVLPHTRLAFRIALGTSDLFGDGRSVDGHGLDVDVLLDSEASLAPASILRLADAFAPR